MAFILFSALSSTLILFIFKYLQKYNTDLIYPIIINYLTALVWGIILDFEHFQDFSLLEKSWFYPAIFIGFMLIVMFFVIGTSTQKAGIAPTSVASKMSVAIPMAFAIWYLSEPIYLRKLAGIVLALVAVVLAVWKKNTTTKAANNKRHEAFWLPVVLFFGAGLIDTLMEYSQHELVADNETAMFTGVAFGFSFLFGLALIIFSKKTLKTIFKKHNVVGGLLLGTANFGSIFFLLQALKTAQIDDSVVFGLNNVLVVVFSTLAGLLVFKEKFSKLNILGYLVAFVAIYLLFSTKAPI